LLVQAGGVEGVAATAVRKCEQGRGANVCSSDEPTAGPGGVRHGRSGGDDVGTQAVHLEGGADLGDLEHRRLPQGDLLDALASQRDPSGELGLAGRVPRDEARGVAVEVEAAPHHLDAQGGIAWGGHLDGEAEAVEQLGAKLTLLRVHRADQHEPGAVADRDAVPLDRHLAGGGGVEQQVDEVVVEQVDLVDVQDAAVGASQEPGLELDGAGSERLLEVERAEHPVLRGPDRQLHQTDRTAHDRTGAGEEVGRGRGRVVRVGGEPVAVADVIQGSTSASPRTVVDLAVPFSPRTSTPPISGLIELSTRARPMSSRPEAVVGSYSQPTTAENGYFSGTLRLPLVGRGLAHAR